MIFSFNSKIYLKQFASNICCSLLCLTLRDPETVTYRFPAFGNKARSQEHCIKVVIEDDETPYHQQSAVGHTERVFLQRGPYDQGTDDGIGGDVEHEEYRNERTPVAELPQGA